MLDRLLNRRVRGKFQDPTANSIHRQVDDPIAGHGHLRSGPEEFDVEAHQPLPWRCGARRRRSHFGRGAPHMPPVDSIVLREHHRTFVCAHARFHRNLWTQCSGWNRGASRLRCCLGSRPQVEMVELLHALIRKSGQQIRAGLVLDRRPD